MERISLFCAEKFKAEMWKKYYPYYKNEKEFDRSFKYVIEIDGCYLVLDNPRIKKDFCFADDYDTPEDNRSGKMCEHARTQKDYFIAENLQEINRQIERYHKGSFAIVGNDFYDNKVIGLIHTIRWGDKLCDYRNDKELKADEYISELSSENKNKIIAALEQIKSDLIQRIDTYLKRYGLTKVNAWSYWAGR